MRKLTFTVCLLICFFACNKSTKTEKIEVITLTKSTKSWNEDSFLHTPEGNLEVTILRITIPSKTKFELHKYTVINAGILLKGELTVISKNNDTL